MGKQRHRNWNRNCIEWNRNWNRNITLESMLYSTATILHMCLNITYKNLLELKSELESVMWENTPPSLKSSGVLQQQRDDNGPSLLSPSEMSSDAKVPMAWACVCHIPRPNLFTQAFRQTGKPQTRWSDQIKYATGLSLETAPGSAVTGTG